LRKIVFIDKENAFAVGEAGIILNTKDNGNNWLANNDIDHLNFLDCNFPTKDTGYILDYNYIFKTTDHGETWEKYKITDDYSCKRLFFIDSQTGFVICSNGKILKTENGGLSWLLIQSSSNTNLEHIKFINKNIGFIIGNPGTILKTIDGGQNWIALNCDYTGQLMDIQTFNQDTINILGNKLVENGYQSVLLETKDGGLTWQEKFKDNLNAFCTMYFINNNIGFLANDKIYKTIDGGITWLKVFEKTNFLNIISISFSNNKNGIAVGEHGVILITEDQGLTWKSIDKGIYNHIFDIHFPNDNIGFGCGDYGTILKTIDSGKNWNVLTSGTTLYFSIFALNEKDVFVVGAGGVINKTADGGLSWSPMTIPNNAFFKIFFLENDIGYLLGMHGSYFITYDKGNTWNEGNIGTDTNLKDIFFLNNNIGYLGCENGMLFKTINGGKKWTLLKSNLGKISKIFFKNENIGFIASNHLYKSIDGGNTWQNLSTSVLDDHECHSILHIAGTKGGVYYCTNKSVFYRNDTMPDWKNVSEGLPYFFNSNIARPFYRDSKIRIASYGKGIWEAPLEEEPHFIIPQIMTDKLEANFICEIDSFYFDDYSVVNHEGVKWKWYFEDGTPSYSEKRNPAVLFTTEGNHGVKMELTDKNGNIFGDSIFVKVEYYKPTFELSEGFETGSIPIGWYYFAGENGGSWSFSDKGAWGNSKFSAVFRNFDYDALGSFSDLRVKSILKANTESKLIFDVAYAEYGGQYTDTLEVLISQDCGKTFSSLYLKGGDELATHSKLEQAFSPGETDWRTDTIDLPQFEKETELIIAFRNHGHWGNNLYIDNININKNTTPVKETEEITLNVFPNPVKSGNELNIVTEGEKYEVKIFDEYGKLILSKNIEGQINKLKLPANLRSGQYYLNVRSEKHIANRVLTVIE